MGRVPNTLRDIFEGVLLDGHHLGKHAESGIERRYFGVQQAITLANRLVQDEMDKRLETRYGPRHRNPVFCSQ